ncbi:MAG: phosphoglucosamine mutase [Propionibacteriaceae bacterium]|jgi:phosphoglucosamine mutase|nr:phosphoglucosamine mutase [Propionibacteriaceae bacterium]
MPRLFGTDGVRGVANQDLTAELALELSLAAARVLGEAGAFGTHRPLAVVGRDTRASGEFLEAAVIAGLASAGVDVIRLDIMPTPGVAFLVGHLNADLGVVLSASHNPMPDNGIKFFARGGVKLDDAIEDAIEESMTEPWERPIGAGVGRVIHQPEAISAYVSHLIGSLQGENVLAGLTVVIDAANGAGFETAQRAFSGQGARVIPIHVEPDGLNINENCGSTHLNSLRKTVVASGADLGIALDGDADRCLAVDKEGEDIDGDQILAILALAMKGARSLHSDTVVATVMSNIGFLNAMKEHGIHVDQTKVGDRYVLEDMNANGFTLGGEQSGHIIMSEYATTGDGVLTGLHVAAQVARTGKSLHELAGIVTRFPQVLVNVPGVNKIRAGIDPELNMAVTAAAKELGDTGRVLLRPSGTEPLVRVMVEAPTLGQAEKIAQSLAAKVKERLTL